MSAVDNAGLRTAGPTAARQRMRRREAIDGYVFMLPAILGLLLFLFGPMVVSFL